MFTKIYLKIGQFIFLILFCHLSIANDSLNFPQILLQNKKISFKNGKIRSLIPLKLPKDMDAEEKLNIFSDENKFFLILVGATDSVVATTLVYAVNDSGQLKWSFDLGAFNPSQPLIEKDSIYLAGIGVVTKLEKSTGKVIWTHTNLYQNEKYKFNGAETITRKKNTIVFSQNLFVNDSTGKMTEVIL